MSDKAQEILKQIQSGGWDSLMKQPAAGEDVFARAKEAEVELRKCYARVFSTPDGQKVLEHLWSLTSGRSTWWPSHEVPTIEQCTAYGLMREGQNLIVATIAKYVAEGMAAPGQVKKVSKRKKGATPND